jgi:uncharacterized protein (DUF58 family)
MAEESEGSAVNTASELSELLEEVRRIEAQSNQLVTSVMAGGYSSVFHGSGIEFAEVREYVDGDDPRSVDWNVTARVGRPFIKEYVEERERMLVFLLDLSASMSGGFGLFSPRQMAARICACLALSANSNDDGVGLIAFSRGVDKFLPPRKGVRHVLRIVRECLAVQPGSAQTELAPALEFASQVLRRRAILFVMSDFLGSGWGRALSICARHHDTIAVRLLTPELTPPEAGLVRLRDPESGHQMVVDWRSRRVRKAYIRRVAEWRTRSEQDLRRAGVDLMDVPVPREYDRDAVARPILEFFRMREERGSKR